MKQRYTVGVDVGSTTVKCVLLDEAGEIVHSVYDRHYSKVKETVTEQLKRIFSFYSGEFKIAMTGSAGLGLSSAASLPFVQEVYAASLAIKKMYPDADCAVELGGEDAKILFLTGGTEQRMNGSWRRRHRRVYRSDGHAFKSFRRRAGRAGF